MRIKSLKIYCACFIIELEFQYYKIYLYEKGKRGNLQRRKNVGQF